MNCTRIEWMGLNAMYESMAKCIVLLKNSYSKYRIFAERFERPKEDGRDSTVP